jgi:hypothetical protein
MKERMKALQNERLALESDVGEAVEAGDLAACAGATQKGNAPDPAIAGRQLSVVAGTGFEPVTFRL